MVWHYVWKIQRVICIVLCVFLACVFFMPSGYAQQTSPYTIKIPKELGTVKERYRGSTDKVVIQIQDAHTSYQAQANIARIIESLVSEDTIDTVAVEGAEGELLTNDFRTFPESTIRWNVAEALVAQGYLTGSELAGIGMKKPVTLYGVENMKIYRRNLEKFRAVMSKRENILDELDRIEEALNQLREKMYPEQLFAFDRSVDRYQQGKSSFVEYLKKVIGYAGTVGISLYDYPNIALLAESFQAITGLSDEAKRQITMERNALIVDLLRRSKDIKLTQILHKVEEQSAIPSEEKQFLLDSFLVKQIRAYHIAETTYPLFMQQATFAERFCRVDHAALFDELDALARAVARTLAGNDSGVQELLLLRENLRLMKNLIDLKVVPTQVAQYHENSVQFSSVRYLNFLRTYTQQYAIPYHPSSGITLIDDVLSIAEEFYRYAEARSKILVDQTMQRLQETNEKTIVLVAGGYHTESMVAALKKKGASYLVVEPRMDTIELTVPYMERMMGQRSAAELRFESAFSTIAAELLLNDYDTLNTGLRAFCKTHMAIAERVLFAEDYEQSSVPLLPLSVLPDAWKNQKQFETMGKKLGDLSAVYVTVTPNADKTVKSIDIYNSTQGIKVHFDWDKEGARGSNSFYTDDELKQVIKNNNYVTLDTLSHVLIPQVSKSIDEASASTVEELMKRIRALFAVADTPVLSQENLVNGFKDIFTVLGTESKQWELRIAGLAAYRAGQQNTAVITGNVIRELGNGTLEAGVEIVNQMLARDAGYNRNCNVFFRALATESLKHTVLIVCDTKEDKTVIEQHLPAADKNTFYTIKVLTKNEIVSPAQSRPGKELSLLNVVNELHKEGTTAYMNFPHAVVGALAGEIAADSEHNVFTFQSEPLRNAVGGKEKWNLIDLLLAAGQSTENGGNNVVQRFLDYLAGGAARFMEVIETAMQQLRHEGFFKTMA